jgi:mRNA-degrading endonuclease RelE of RelBE toxin-antitoxin system
MKFFYLLSILLILFSCSSGDDLTAKELELRERELAIKEKELGMNSSSESSSKQIQTAPRPKEKTEKELQRELADKECKNALNYLSKKNTKLEGRYKNALSLKFDGYKIKIDVQNNAKIVTFKNVKCRVTFTSSTGGKVLQKDFTIFDYVAPGRIISYKGEFNCSHQEFIDAKSYTIEIIGAECN